MSDKAREGSSVFMKHIVVDLEMNEISKKYREKKVFCKMEIIEIGAVLLDENYTEIGYFKTLVKPQFNEVIEPLYARITGITTEMVENAPFFEDGLKMFLSWCNSVNDDIQIYQWSDSDLMQIRKEMSLKDVAVSPRDAGLLEEWNDFQKEYGDKLMIHRQVSLKNAIMYAGLDFEGKEHDALCDARNTGTLLRIIRDPELCKDALDKVIEIMTPKTLSATLGDLFDFNELFEAFA